MNYLTENWIECHQNKDLSFEIANFLFQTLPYLLDIERVRGHGLELEVRGELKNRYPDLTIIREEHIQLLSQRNTDSSCHGTPLLVLEVVSPGKSKRERLHR
jgi:Uma2 family endonuclease